MTEKWNAAHYLKYGDERTRAAADLASQIKLARPGIIADLGCGPGNSTQILRSRWPDSNVFGIDNSAEMIATAKISFPNQKWVLADVADWTPASSIALIFSNAALQWLPSHASLIPRLFSFVAPEGALAFQIPSSTHARVRMLIQDISYDPAWTQRMTLPRKALTMEPPSFYYDALAADASSMDIWGNRIPSHHGLTGYHRRLDFRHGPSAIPFRAAYRG